MNFALVSAIVAALAHATAAATGRRAVSFIAAAAGLCAVAARLPAVGAATVGLAIALGLTVAAVSSRNHKLHWLAAAASLPGALFAAAALPAGWIAWVGASAGTAMIVGSTVAACRAAASDDRDMRAALAFVLAAAPVPLLAVSPMAAAVEWPMGLSPVATIHRGVVHLPVAEVSEWAVLLWQAIPWIGAAAVAAVWGLGRRALWPVFALWALCIAVAVAGEWPVVAAWLDESLNGLTADQRLFPVSAVVGSSARQIDGAAGLFTVVRWGIAAALMWAPAAGRKTQSGTAGSDGLVAATGVAAVSVWSLAAPGFIGPYWLLDPAVLAVLAATVASIALLHFRAGAPATVLRALQVIACGLVVGGGDLSWRVASALVSG